MATTKQPYIPLYTGDYLKATRRLTLEVRGAWIDLLIFMWESDEKGTITGTMDEFAMMMGCPVKKAEAIIADLKDKNICDFEEKSDGKIKLSSRRILKDIELSKTRKKAGIKGGNPNLVNQKSTKNKKDGYPFSDNEYDTGIPDKKEPEKLFDSYPDGKTAFEEIKADEQFVGRVVRIARNSGYLTYTEMQVMKAVKRFITLEEAKPDFDRRPRDEIKKHLVNWMNLNAKKIADHG